MKRSLFSSFLALAGLSHGQVLEQARMAPPPKDLVAAESGYYQRVPLAVPEGIVLEVGGILPQPGRRLLVATRRGEIWWVDGAYDAEAKPRFTLFAQGLHEVLGIVPAPQGGYYVAQRQEITHIADENNDGRADRFDTVFVIPISGNYHEYAFGPVLAPNGNLRIALNVSFGAPTQSYVPWRGWMLEITPGGDMKPIAAGFRSPAGVALTSKGDWLYAENQGEWSGSGRVTEIQPGDFMGHVASLAWAGLPDSPVKLRLSDLKNFGRPMHEVAKEIPSLKGAAVWFPHTILGISTAAILEDTTGGKFGPFAGQFFVADQGQSKIMRMSLERVKGVLQGASYPFLSGFECGVLRLAWGEDGTTLFAGETNRGWGSTGPKGYGLERVVWKGQKPFELQEITAQPDGFVVRFTEPVDPVTAGDPKSYSVSGFTYNYHRAYGSPIVGKQDCPVRKVVVAADGLSVRIAAACLREGYVHEVKAAGVRTRAGGRPLLHDAAYYTMNRLPDGELIVPREQLTEICASIATGPAGRTTTPDSPLRITQLPSNWGGAPDVVVTLNAKTGLKFDQELLVVKAGARIRLTFHNPDDMLHNFVLTKPGRGQAVGDAAMQLGIDGIAKNYVPDSADVLAHTALLQPETEETIYFTAPSQPGDYDFVCSFPGHAAIMRGILRVE